MRSAEGGFYVAGAMSWYLVALGQKGEGRGDERREWGWWEGGVEGCVQEWRRGGGMEGAENMKTKGRIGG